MAPATRSARNKPNRATEVDEDANTAASLVNTAINKPSRKVARRATQNDNDSSLGTTTLEKLVAGTGRGRPRKATQDTTEASSSRPTDTNTHPEVQVPATQDVPATRLRSAKRKRQDSADADNGAANNVQKTHDASDSAFWDPPNDNDEEDAVSNTRTVPAKRVRKKRKPNASTPRVARASTPQEDEEGAETERDNEPRILSDDGRILLKVNLLRTMWLKSEQIQLSGFGSSSKDQAAEDNLSDEPDSEECSNLLIYAKEALRLLHRMLRGKDEEHSHEESLLDDALDDLKRQLDVIVDGTLSKERYDADSVLVVADMLLHVLPAMHELLYVAARCYARHKTISDANLRNLDVLTASTHIVYKKTLVHKKKQAEEGIRKGRLSKVDTDRAKGNTAQLSLLLSALRDERDIRKARANEQAEIVQSQLAREEQKMRWQQQQAAREARMEREKEQLVERRVAYEENRRRRAKQLRDNLNHPIHGSICQGRLLQDYGSAAVEYALGYQDSDSADSESGDESHREVDANDDEIERISVFDHDTRSKSSRHTWTDSERELFVNLMQQHKKFPDEVRWQVAAQRLGKSTEDVIQQAISLQRCMDDMHERGELQGEEHAWTYLIFDFDAYVEEA